jgi:hypothetical protein
MNIHAMRKDSERKENYEYTGSISTMTLILEQTQDKTLRKRKRHNNALQ